MQLVFSLGRVLLDLELKVAPRGHEPEPEQGDDVEVVELESRSSRAWGFVPDLVPVPALDEEDEDAEPEERRRHEVHALSIAPRHEGGLS